MVTEDVLVKCLCGQEMLRRPVVADLGETWPCFMWYDLAGEVLDRCPTCYAITSALTTFPAAIIDALRRFEALPPADQARVLELVNLACAQAEAGEEAVTANEVIA